MYNCIHFEQRFLLSVYRVVQRGLTPLIMLIILMYSSS
jgi:hypothetical protein